MINTKCLSCDGDNYLQTSSFFITDITSVKHPEHGFKWKSFFLYKVKKFRRVYVDHGAFTRVRTYAAWILQITDPADTKQIHLAPMEFSR